MKLIPDIEELNKKGVKYKNTYWNWKAPNYVLQTSEFNAEGDFDTMLFIDYVTKWAQKLNEQEGTKIYIVAKRKYETTEVISVVKLNVKGRDENN